MRRKEILLDFTSLVDIVLIILFFFILFSHFEVESAKNDLERQLAEAARAEQAAEEAREQYESDRRILQDTSARTADVAREITAFANSVNLRLVLRTDGVRWTLEVLRGEDSFALLAPGDRTNERLREAVTSAGCTPEDTILCVFVYEGDRPGSYTSYRIVSSAISALRTAYPYLYVSEIDLSITGG